MTMLLWLRRPDRHRDFFAIITVVAIAAMPLLQQKQK
jgi:hypothetical protein